MEPAPKKRARKETQPQEDVAAVLKAMFTDFAVSESISAFYEAHPAEKIAKLSKALQQKVNRAIKDGATVSATTVALLQDRT